MAAVHNWTPAETRAMPRLFIQELLARHEAEANHHEKKSKRERKHNRISADAEVDRFPE